MTQILADLFRHAQKNEIGQICYLLQGRVVPLYEAVEFGIADKFMIRAIAKAYDVSEEQVKREFKKRGDLGVAAEICYHVPLHSSRSVQPSIIDVYKQLFSLAHTGGHGSQEKKIGMLSDVLRRVDRLSSRYIVRIPLDKLRLGFSDMTILDGLSWMESGNKSFRPKLEAAYNVRPDIGYLATTVKTEGIKGIAHVRVKVGAPILASLCARLPNADDMVKKMGEVAVEPKYDGVRVQVHFKRGAFVSSYSRNLENTTAMFPELSEIGKELNAQEVILDSEAVGYDGKNDKLIAFQETMTRKRKHGISEASKSIPVRFFVFDILYKDGRELLGLPLSQRRKILEYTLKSAKNRHLMLSPQIVTHEASVIRTYHDEQLKKGLEGAVVKKWNSVYEPGRTGYHWVKFKEEEGKTGKLTDTIDAVVMGYTVGQGKRTEFGVGQMLLGVKDKEDFVTITKLGSGASEEELGKLAHMLKKLRVKDRPKEYKNVNKIYTPDFWVRPSLVLEIAGDDLTRSPAHSAGFAVRFPRLVRIRADKSPDQATTVTEISHMYKNQVSAR